MREQRRRRDSRTERLPDPEATTSYRGPVPEDDDPTVRDDSIARRARERNAGSNNFRLALILLLVGSGLALLVGTLACVIAVQFASTLPSPAPSDAVAAVAASQPSPPESPAKLPDPKIDWSQVRDRALAGDVEVSVLRAHTEYLMTHAYVRGEFRNLGAILFVYVQVANKHPTRNLSFGGWNNANSRLEDEHGNLYKLMPFGKATRLYDPAGQTWFPGVVAEPATIHAGKSGAYHLYFEPIPNAAREVRLTLPGQVVGADRPIHLRRLVVAKQ